MVNENLELIQHKIRVRLYPNYLSGVKGAYLARTDSERTLNVEDVCSILKTRGGYEGDYNKLVDAVHSYLDEVAYQLCDGYAVNNGYFAIWMNVGGTFDTVNELHDNKKHPIDVRFGIRSKLYELLRTIKVEMLGLADVKAFIDTFTDEEAQTVNGVYVVGNMFSVHGSKIKIEGNDPSVGLYFVPVDDPTKAVKVSRIGKNNPSEVTGIAPDTGFKNNRVEIRTQFSQTSQKPLKKVRTITTSFALEAS